MIIGKGVVFVIIFFFFYLGLGFVDGVVVRFGLEIYVGKELVNGRNGSGFIIFDIGEIGW